MAATSVELEVRNNPPDADREAVEELVGIVRQMVDGRGEGASAEGLVERLLLGQRLLFVTIPFAERLAASGPARKQALLHVIELARAELAAQQGRAAELDALRFALDALRFALESGFEAAIVSSFKDRQGQRVQEGGHSCLRALMRFIGATA